MKMNKKIRKSLYYDGPPYKIDLRFILLIVAFVVYFIICDGCYSLFSFIGKKNVIIVTVVTVLKVLSHFTLWWFGGFLIIRWLHKDGYNLKWSEILKPILMIIVLTVAIACSLLLYQSNINPDRGDDDLLYDFLLPFYVISDIAGDNTETIESDNYKRVTYVSEGNRGEGNISRTYWHYLHVGTRVFTLGNTEAGTYKQLSYDKSLTVSVEYYSKSGLIKSIDIISPKTDTETQSDAADEQNNGQVNAQIPLTIPENIEIWLEESRFDDPVLLVCRPEIPGYDDYNEDIRNDSQKRKLYWYITKGGKYCDCLSAYQPRVYSTTFLTFQEPGEYTVTLVVNYNELTHEYTPISNTLNVRLIEYDEDINKWIYEIS